MKDKSVSHQHQAPFNFGKLFDPEASWDKDQLGDVLHWIRQVVGLICGLLWGTVSVVVPCSIVYNLYSSVVSNPIFW
ncbi:hypothetical protein MKX03_018573, partial [Papaver bracteatum]